MSTYTLYPYQQESLNQAKARNTIVNLPTGFGKTLIAAKLIDHYLRQSPHQTVAFLVPTRPLVEQQSNYCKKHCRLPSGSTPVIQKLVGENQASWQQSDWDVCVQKSHILLGTAALFEQAFVTDRRISIGQISLIVFDECHNACGNSPMAVVMRDGVAPYQARGLPGPRILGLTASFVNGNLKNIEQKRRNIESLLLSTLHCPDVEQRITEDRFCSVHWAKAKDADKQCQAIEDHVEIAINHVGNIKELRKVVRRCIHVFEELGYDALMFYIDKVIIEQIIVKTTLLKDQGEINSLRCANAMINGLPALRSELKTLQLKLLADPQVNRTKKASPKADALIQLIHGLFQNKDPAFSGIVFVEQVALVSSMAKMLNDSLASLGIRSAAVAGTGYQSETDRQTQLGRFESGEIRILAATATLEEGIDVSQCAFVVRYTSVATTKAHIQGAGRARHPNASIYYFENNPRVELQKQASMTAAAKDTSLSLMPSELDDAVRSISIPSEKRHPYPFLDAGADISGEVNVFTQNEFSTNTVPSLLAHLSNPKRTYTNTKIKQESKKFFL